MLAHRKCKIFLGKEECNPPKSYNRKGHEILQFLKHQIQNFLWQGGLQPPEIIYLYKFRLKQGQAHQFLRQAPPCNPKNHV